MKQKNIITSLFVTDNNIGIYCLNKEDHSKSKHIDFEIEKNVIENGYIHDPYNLYVQLKTAFKSLKHLPKELNFVFLGQNVLIRELTISKETLAHTSVFDYIKGQIGITIHFPFNEAAYYYNVKSEDEIETKIIVFIIDKNLLEDYLDVLEKLGIKDIHINLLSADINYLYNDKKNTILDNTMIVSLLENNITIHILENNMTVFGINDECEDTNESAVCYRVSDFVEKIANYYQFNLRKGKSKISNIILINLSKQVDNNTFKQGTSDLGKEYKLIVLDISDVNPNLNPESKHSNIAYISSMANLTQTIPKMEFNVDRPRKSLMVANYLFVLSVLIFALVSLVYIPWTNMNQEIQDLEASRQSLIIQLEMLADNVQYDVSYSNYQRDYNLAFSTLNSLSISPSDHLSDLMNLATGDITVVQANINESDKTITLIVASDDDYYLYNYAITIYESHGIITTTTEARWILYPPDITMIASGSMRVVIYYA